MSASATVVSTPAPADAPATAPVLNSSSAAASSLPTPVSGPVATPPPAQSEQPSRPAGLPEQFKTMEEFTKAYEALATKTPNEPPAPSGDAPTVESVTSKVEAAGLDVDVFSAEYNRDGKLSEASYAELEKAGMSKQFVDSFIAGQVAIETQQTDALYKSVGGEEQFKRIQEWARVNLAKNELEAFNNICDSASFDMVTLAVQGLAARYQAKNGNEPSLIGATNANATSLPGFQSQAQVVAAMRDPRYKSDPVYREEVEQRLVNSPRGVIN